MKCPTCPSCGQPLTTIDLTVPKKANGRTTTFSVDWDGYSQCWRTYLYKEEDLHRLVVSCDECQVHLELEQESLDHYDGGDVLTLRPSSILLMESLL